ncbi:MAG: TrmB family transcriptional regulator [Cyanobacteria bacterium SIG31]|nr:TrmB family transcriptional regulator [Cyanobacteria bacterium SIG31]
MADLVEKLKEIGFNSYEAKVYIALLKKHPATGYEVSKLANIPQARTYDTLKVLEEKSIVVPTNTKPVTYTPIKPKQLITSYQKKMNSTINYLEKHLPEVKENYVEPVVTINGKQNIHNKIIEVIQNAKREIYLEVWSQDYKFFEQELLNAYNRNVEIRIVGYDNFTSRFGMVFEHAFAKDIEMSLGGRMIILAADDSEGIIGKISSFKNENPDLNIIWTKNKSIVFIIKEFIVHDMYLIDVEENLIEQMKYIYGKGFKRLKDKVLGANSTYMIH